MTKIATTCPALVSASSSELRHRNEGQQRRKRQQRQGRISRTEQRGSCSSCYCTLAVLSAMILSTAFTQAAAAAAISGGNHEIQIEWYENGDSHMFYVDPDEEPGNRRLSEQSYIRGGGKSISSSSPRRRRLPASSHYPGWNPYDDRFDDNKENDSDRGLRLKVKSYLCGDDHWTMALHALAANGNYHIWGDSDKERVLKLEIQDRGCDTSQRQDPGDVVVINDEYPDKKWCGLMTATVSGGHYMTAALVQINTICYSGPDRDTPERIQFALCHELGHALGLGHDPSGEPTCMSGAGDVAHPSAEDLNVLRDLYGKSRDSYFGDHEEHEEEED